MGVQRSRAQTDAPQIADLPSSCLEGMTTVATPASRAGPRRARHVLAARYLTVDECADLLRVSERTIRELINRGVLPSLRVGTRIRVKRADIDRHLRSKHAA